MTTIADIRKKSERDLEEFVREQRDILRQERFKDKISRKASVIRDARAAIARALTELNARRRNPQAN